MARYKVEHNGKWACFSSIPNGFVTKFMDKDAYEQWRKAEYGCSCLPIEQSLFMPLPEAVFSAGMNRTREEWIACLRESGLYESDVIKLIYDCDTEYYVPRLVGDRYECPNCGNVVELNQDECSEESCENKLVWRLKCGTQKKSGSPKVSGVSVT